MTRMRTWMRMTIETEDGDNECGGRRRGGWMFDLMDVEHEVVEVGPPDLILETGILFHQSREEHVHEHRLAGAHGAVKVEALRRP